MLDDGFKLSSDPVRHDEYSQHTEFINGNIYGKIAFNGSFSRRSHGFQADDDLKELVCFHVEHEQNLQCLHSSLLILIIYDSNVKFHTQALSSSVFKLIQLAHFVKVSDACQCMKLVNG